MFRVLPTALLTLTLATASAQAVPLQAVPQDVSVNVAFGDLDLSKPGDLRVLASRLQTAATSACASANTSNGQPAPAYLVHACVDDAIAEALTPSYSKNA
jgi:UrcA family protein